MTATEVRAVFLVGFMGSGKNTVGQELARRLSWNFSDLDALIEARESQTIPEIFTQKGEPYFRAAENATLVDLVNFLTRNTVVALGGGSFVEESNRNLLRCWPSVFLDAPVSELWQRCLDHEAADGARRPLRGDQENFTRLHQARLPFYRQATLTVNTSDKSAAAICKEIEHGLQLS